MRTVMEVIRLAAEHLEESGVATPRLDAEVLLADVLDLDRIQLYVQHDRPLNPDETGAFRASVARRARREPVAYIIGRREFASLDMTVDSRVLVPRPETEHLVDVVVEELTRRFSASQCLSAADVGTGSGALAVALCHRLPELQITATDISKDALDVASINSHRHGVGDRITMRCGDLLAPLAGSRYHAVVSNPPYVSAAEWASLDPDVREHEPRRALVGGQSGTEVIERLVSQVQEHLVAGGFVALEIGASQGEALHRLAARYGFGECRIVQDLAGRDRVVVLAPGATDS